jgi:hypothetical protein
LRTKRVIFENQDEYLETPLGGEIWPQPVAGLAPPNMEQLATGEEEAQIAQRLDASEVAN